MTPLQLFTSVVSVTQQCLYHYSVMGGGVKVGTKWKFFMETCMFYVFMLMFSCIYLFISHCMIMVKELYIEQLLMSWLASVTNRFSG